MRAILKAFLLLVVPAFSFAQSNTVDSLKAALKNEKHDTSRVLLLVVLSRAYASSRPDTALVLGQQALALAKKSGFRKGEAISLNRIGLVFSVMGDYPKALQLSLEALKTAETIRDETTMNNILRSIGNVYAYLGDHRQSVDYTRKALFVSERINNQDGVQTCLTNLGDSYEKLGMLDSALRYTKRAYALAVQLKSGEGTGIPLINLGNIYSKMGQDATALEQYRASLPYFIQAENDDALCETYLGMAKVFQKRGNRDSSLYYAKRSFATGKKGGFISRVMDASAFLTGYYTAIHNVDSAFAYQSATIAAKDSLFSQEKAQEIQSLGYDETVRQQQVQEAKQEAQTQLKFNMLFVGLGALLVVAFLLFRNNRHKQKANRLLQKQKFEIEAQRDQTDKALTELKATQAQLVQAEKMASLGELTAGIAHEIQNPLNFVNNFSEVNKEMIEELQTELKAGNTEEAIAISNDIKDNEEKINHHGKRADSIVKGMLQHSRTNTGQKEPTDINALCDEYLRLSFHGLRAKDKTFNADFKTDFDETIGKINIVPQDMGRVLLNLFNNAFYAVHEHLKKSGGAYKPAVIVSTKKLDDKIEIRVKDNGMGISKSLQDKIFQPFFTTKPTGQGTGLGLSLSYDIVKVQGGDIKVESEEGEGTTFTIVLQP